MQQDNDLKHFNKHDTAAILLFPVSLSHTRTHKLTKQMNLATVTEGTVQTQHHPKQTDVIL